MSSTKSNENLLKTAKTPLRQNGKLRVAAILKAGAEVIAEKGFEGATMAEIAARSKTQVGSLYRFFPNKAVLGNALMEHYHEGINQHFEELNARLEGLSVAEFADALVNLMIDFRKDRETIRKLLESPLSSRRGEFRASIQRHISRAVQQFDPSVCPEMADDLAGVVLHCSKTMASISEDPTVRAGTLSEFRFMVAIYLEARLKRRLR